MASGWAIPFNRLHKGGYLPTYYKVSTYNVTAIITLIWLTMLVFIIIIDLPRL